MTIPITGDSQQLLPLDSLGGNKFYGESSRDTSVLQPLQAYGQAAYHNPGGAVVLPMLQVSISARQDGTAEGNVLLPAPITAGGTGGQGAITLPVLSSGAGGTGGTGTVVPFARGAITLPALHGAGTGLTGAGATGDAPLPMIRVAWQTGFSLGVTLPRLRVVGSVSSIGQGSGAGVLPLLRTSGIVVVSGYSARGAIVLPALRSGPYVSGAVLLPMLDVVGVGGQLVDLGDVTGFEGWMLNLRNTRATRQTNMPFTEFTLLDNVVYAIGPDGLYRLGGDTDAGDPIQWQFETGLDDMGRPGVKRVPYVYLDGIIDGEVMITLIEDRNREFAYYYDTKVRGAVHMPHRRKLGNGIRTRSMAFRIGSASGAYIELDSIEPQIEVTQRSI